MSESISVAATPDELYALVSDVTRMGEWSPVCRACWWDEGDGPTVGSWFTGRNETAERTWETRSQVVAADPGRRFAWQVNNGWVHWEYTFAAGRRRDAAHREVGVPACRHRRVPRTLRRGRRPGDRKAPRRGQKRHSRDPRCHQKGCRGVSFTRGRAPSRGTPRSPRRVPSPAVRRGCRNAAPTLRTGLGRFG